MANLQDSIFTFFAEEAAEHLSVLEAGLLKMEQTGSTESEEMDPLFRAAHTLKGSANLIKLTSVGGIAHRMEDLFEAVRDGKMSATSQHVDALLYALDQIRSLIRARADGEEEPQDAVPSALKRLDEATMFPHAPNENTAAQQDSSASKPVTKTTEFAPQEQEIKNDYTVEERRGLGRRVEEVTTGIRVGAEKIEDLMALIGEVTVVKNHLTDQVHHVERMREDIEFVGQRLLREVTQFADRYDYTMPTQAAPQPQAEIGDFQELEFDRYDDLNLFSRKLREITNDVTEGLRGLNEFFVSFGRDVSSLDRMTDDIKERISEVRTVPVSTLFQRFNRSVRDMARELEREAELYVAGGETRIDRVVYDGLFDPLLHIVRNAFAHGIESSAEREKAGKPKKASIHLRAERRGNTVEISVTDDGRGIDLAQVRKRAIEKGFITAEDRMSERELIQMIFRPGFSTTAKADATSGRGVGMSVVMDRLAALNGTIEVDTVKGQGSTFRLRLPLSLVIVNVLRFVVADQMFVIPAALVEEIQDLAYEKSRRQKGELTQEPPEQVDLRELFNLPRGTEPAGHGILTQSEGVPILLLVDEVLGQEDTVIKPFGNFLRDLPFFSGSSLAGDGSMRLVVSPARMKQREKQIADSAIDQLSQKSVPVQQQQPRVLIVDDSLSVRKYAGMLLAGKGLQILTAADGMEALNLLEKEDVDSIITDLEMPHMHGYELLAELQRRADWQVPMAVLSSRAGEQHQQKALSLGATDYLVKPFEEEDLMRVIRKHLAINGKSL